MQLRRVRVLLYRFDEGVDRAVLLFVEQVVESLEVGAWRAVMFEPQLAQVEAGGQPAQPEGDGQRQQKPQGVDLHRCA